MCSNIRELSILFQGRTIYTALIGETEKLNIIDLVFDSESPH